MVVWPCHTEKEGSSETILISLKIYLHVQIYIMLNIVLVCEIFLFYALNNFFIIY